MHIPTHSPELLQQLRMIDEERTAALAELRNQARPIVRQLRDQTRLKNLKVRVRNNQKPKSYELDLLLDKSREEVEAIEADAVNSAGEAKASNSAWTPHAPTRKWTLWQLVEDHRKRKVLA